MPPSPNEIYTARLRNRLLKPDASQARAASSLQRLYSDLKEKKPSRLKFWHRRKDGPKGIYMHGGVGRGKSMLMDLFYESLPDNIDKRRVHFHAFMIEVHDYIHARQADDDFDDGMDGVLPMFAARLAEKTRVLCFDEFHVTDVADAMILGEVDAQRP